MDGRSGRSVWTNVARHSPRVILVTVFLTLVPAPEPARAGAIRSHALPGPVRTELTLGPAWSRFLAGGPGLWAVARPPRFPSGLSLLTRNGQIVDTPFVDYLVWRRNLNPARFDRYHPFIGPALGRLLPPPSPPKNPNPAPGQIDPPITPPRPQVGTPEPGTISIAVVLTGIAWAYRRRSTRKG